MKLSHQITYIVLSILSKWLSLMSREGRDKLAIRIARLAYYHYPVRKDQAQGNLQLALPKKSQAYRDEILKKCTLFFARNFIQFMSLPNSYHTAHIIVHGKNILDDALHQGKGVVLVTGHFGSWEMLASWLGYNRYAFKGVAFRQKNLGANKFFLKQRELSGIQHIDRRSSLEEMYDVLNQGKILGLVSDQDQKYRGVFVDFFGQPASTAKGAARFHLATGAPIVFITCHYENKHTYVIDIEPISVEGENDIFNITQSFTSHLEDKIRLFPEQYFWFHRRWKTKKPSCHRVNVNQPDAIQKAADTIRKGGIIAYPTDTLYGFGVDVRNSKAVQRLCRIKGRGGPWSIVVSDLTMLQQYAKIPNGKKTYLDTQLPGKVTFILPAVKSDISPLLLGNNETVGIRLPAYSFPTELVRNLGYPITSTSVNRTGEKAINNPYKIIKEFGFEIDLIINAGTLPPSEGSQIIDISTTEEQILRNGDTG